MRADRPADRPEWTRDTWLKNIQGVKREKKFYRPANSLPIEPETEPPK